MKKLALATLAGSLLLTGCATSNLLDSPATTTTKQSQNILLEDRVVAFGRPAAAGLANQVVIVGESNSYVLNDGGHQLVNLLSNLDAKNIHVDSNLDFYSANDGKFEGVMKLSYSKIKDEFKRDDIQFFLQNNAKECTNSSDERMGAQRFCFDLALKGAIYPRVSNYDLVRTQFSPLSRPYSVRLYNTSTTQVQQGRSGAEKLVLLPFALAFDVVTLPVQILGAL